MKTSGVKKVLFWGLTIAFPLLLIEILLRIYFATQLGAHILVYGVVSSREQKVLDPVGFTARTGDVNHTVMHSYNRVQGYEKFFPHQTPVDFNEHGDVFSVTINSRGFRGAEFDTTRDPETLRIVTIGASSTFGFHDKDDETYPSYMQDTLSALLAENGCSPYQGVTVMNLAIPGLMSEQMYALFLAEALRLHPDVVTFYEGYNDSHRPQVPSTTLGQAKHAIKTFFGLEHLYNFLRAKSITVALLANLNSTLAMRYSGDEVSEYIQGRAEHFMANVEAMEKECRERGILFIVASQQMKSFVVDRDKMNDITYQDELALINEELASGKSIGMYEREMLAHETLMRAEREWAEQHDVPYVDVIERLNRHRRELVSYVHLSPFGNRIVASAFSHKIVSLMCGNASGQMTYAHSPKEKTGGDIRKPL